MDKKNRNRSREARELGNQALEYHQQSDYVNAIKAFQEFLIITRELGERQAEGVALTYLGNSYLNLKCYAQAVEFFELGLPIVQEFNDLQGQGVILSGLGVAFENLGYFTRALESYFQLLNVAQTLQDFLLKGTALLGLSSTYNALGNDKRANEFNQKALSLALYSANRQLEGRVLANIGNTYVSLEDYSRAVESFQQSLAIAQGLGDSEGEANVLRNLAKALLFLDQPNQALEGLQRSLAIARTRQDLQAELDTLSLLGLLHERVGQFDQALQFYQGSLAIAKDLRNHLSEGIALNNLGGAYQVMGQLAAAETNLRAATQVWAALRANLSDINRISLFDEQTRTYGLLQQVLISQNRPEDALEIAEEGRARAFVALLSRGLSPAHDKNSVSPDFEVDPPDIRRIREVAASLKATLVEYSTLFGENLFIWVVQPTGEVIFRQADLTSLDTSLEDLVISSRNAIITEKQNRKDSATMETSQHQTKQLQKLYQILIATIVDVLPVGPNDQVIFMPQGLLFLVPFPALQDPSGVYLVEKHIILSAPAIQILELIQQRNNVEPISFEEALVVGNPKPMPSISVEPGNAPQPLANLPGAEQEAQGIARLLNTYGIIGAEATKGRVLAKISKAQIVHLATHGLLNSIQEPDLPGAIALAPSEEDNGLLTAAEILKLKLNAELVVLSACDTGRGRITGDGVIGLSRSLIAAGVSSVIVSLWPVSDESTRLLMMKFYQNLQQRMAVSIAFNEAQRWLLKSTKSAMEDWLDVSQNLFNPTLKIKVQRQLNQLSKEEQPFYKPWYWAAFTTIGR